MQPLLAMAADRRWPAPPDRSATSLRVRADRRPAALCCAPSPHRTRITRPMASVLFRLLLCLALLVDGTLPAFAMARLAQADAEMASMPAMPPGHDCDHAGAADAVTAPPASPADAAQAHSNTRCAVC